MRARILSAIALALALAGLAVLSDGASRRT
jgi:hypothetical protein